MVVEPRSEQEAAYGRFVGAPSRAELERFFFLDDADKRLIAKRRGDRNRVGFALQLGTVRFLGMFLADPTDVPAEVLGYVAEQVGTGDASCLDGYMGRRATRFEHMAQIVAEYGYRDFAAAEKELVRWLDDRAWTTGEGPTALFAGAVRWLRERLVLLPGLTTLRRLVGRVRDEAMQRLWDVLAALVSSRQARLLKRPLVVSDGSRVSDLERLRTGPTSSRVSRWSWRWSALPNSPVWGSGRWTSRVCRRGGLLSSRGGVWRARLRRFAATQEDAAWRRCWRPSCTWRRRRSTTRWSCLTC